MLQTKSSGDCDYYGFDPYEEGEYTPQPPKSNFFDIWKEETEKIEAEKEYENEVKN